jgi:hypothetical protein
MRQNKQSDISTYYPIRSIFNRLYKTCFPIYKITYFEYKMGLPTAIISVSSNVL